MFLNPAFKDYIWGGEKLKSHYNKETNLSPLAESWELSLYPDATSIVANGEYKGDSLFEVLQIYPEFCGKKIETFEKFPMLIKFIDAADNLSIQVHPSDKYALQYEKSYGKSEVWYILDAEDGAGIYLGFKQNIEKSQFEKKISDGTLTEILNFIPAKKGDVFAIEAGTLHAIGKGLTILEIQQNSDLTYRVFDYNRVGKDGAKRELHINKALAVTKLSALSPSPFVSPKVEFGSYTKRLVADNKYFFAEHYTLDGKMTLENDDSFMSLTLLEGKMAIIHDNGALDITKGQTVFIPAALKVFLNGDCEFILCSV
jgi:mannose-6-phosphate isomerase